jgi:ACS family hexuronate transporter-like MFS transporter
MSGKTTHLRWCICALLFYATTVNYLDRQVLGLLKPVMLLELGWREADYGWVVFAFQVAYALMMPLAGRIIDRVGTRLSYALAVLLWSIASMSHALARSAMQFAAARFCLGLGEAKRETSPPLSKPLPNGFRRDNAHSPPASSTAEPIWAR